MEVELLEQIVKNTTVSKDNMADISKKPAYASPKRFKRLFQLFQFPQLP